MRPCECYTSIHRPVKRIRRRTVTLLISKLLLPSAEPLPFLLVSNAPLPRYFGAMALVRILIDGYSLLHNWPELSPGNPRHSAAARDELIQRLTLFQDATGTP